MKNDEDTLELEKKEEDGSVPDDDIIELVNVIEAESEPESAGEDPGGLTLEDEIGESISALQGPAADKKGDGAIPAFDETPESADTAVPEFLSEADGEFMVEAMDGEEQLLFDDAPPV